MEVKTMDYNYVTKCSCCKQTKSCNEVFINKINCIKNNKNIVNKYVIQFIYAYLKNHGSMKVK